MGHRIILHSTKKVNPHHHTADQDRERSVQHPRLHPEELCHLMPCQMRQILIFLPLHLDDNYFSPR